MSLKLIIGPMYSGKSFELIKTIRELKILDLPFLVIKPKIDNRYTEEDYIVTHNMDKEVCMVIEDMYELLKMDTLDSYKYLIIDEGQFIKNLCEVSKILVDNLGKNLVIAGLDGDFNREPIGELLNLIPFSDECIKKKKWTLGNRVRSLWSVPRECTGPNGTEDCVLRKNTSKK